MKDVLMPGKNDELVYEGHVKLVRRKYDGRYYDVIVSKNACAIMYIDQEDFVWLVKQYRIPIAKEIIELPAETMDKPGKSSLEVIVEGLEEECGIRIDQKQAHFFATIGSSEGHDTEMVDLYYAYGPHTKTNQRLEDTEKIEVVRIPFYQAYKMISTGEIQGSKTVALLQNEYIKRLEKT
ncbi:MAG: NUDIX hydrolase [Candidatus Woesearchaeota archaeon]|nr:NUDIX hydrolase [Candidatus Woesearchaeota archaeon]